MAQRDIIVIGASAGGHAALEDVLRGLPADLPAAVFVVVHTSPKGSGFLPRILQRVTGLRVMHARDGASIESGNVYVAVTDRHLVLESNRMRTPYGPQENGFRPAVDPLFVSAAQTCGARVIGVILSGALDDGTFGLLQIKRRHGLAIVQDPKEALIDSMPASALRTVDVDHVLPAARIGPMLLEVVSEEVEPTKSSQKDLHPMDYSIHADALETGEDTGKRSDFVCPDCGGPLRESEDAGQLRFRCHVGHGFTADALLHGQGEQVEEALWSALRVLEENAALKRRMGERARQSSLSALAAAYEEQAVEASDRADVIRNVLAQPTGETAAGE